MTQSIASSPTLTGVEVSGSKTILNGKDFPTAGYNAFVSFEGIESSVGVITETNVNVDWTATGVPVSEKGASPKLVFKHKTNGT